MKQSTFSAVMANSIKNLLQGYTKGIRFVAVLMVLLTMGIGQAWAWNTLYLASSNNSWSTNKESLNNASSGNGVFYGYTPANMTFKIVNSYNTQWLGRDNGDKLAPGDGGFNFDKNKGSNCTYSGKPGIVGFNCDQNSPNADDWPWIWLTRPTVKIKHGWNGGTWTVKSMIDQNNGTYTYIGLYSGSKGANFGIEGSTATFKYISETALIGSPQQGHRCLFTYNSNGYKGYGSETQNTGSATITRLYTITYNGNGHTGGTVPDAVDKKHGTNITLSNSTPTRTGYIFVEWNTKQDGTGTSYAKGATYSTEADVTLYAQWQGRLYTVTFDSEGGLGGTSYVTATYGSAMPAIELPKRNGYTFNGYWSGTTTGSTQYYKADGSSARNWDKANNTTTLHAIWIPHTYTVNFDGNGSTSGSMTNQSFTYDISQDLKTNAYVKTGYTFAGWAKASNGAVVYSDKQNVKNLTTDNNATVTLYAQWTLNTYPVKWYVNGEELAGAATTVAHGSKVTTIPEVDLNTYCEGSDVLAGWTTAPMENASVTAPAQLYKTIDDFPTAEGPQTFYAVFADYKE